MTLISFGLACLGFVLLSVSMKRHYHQVWPASAVFQQWCWPNRIVGYCLVFLSLWPCVLLEGWGIGVVLWCSVLALAAFIQAMLLTYWPKRSVLFGGAGLLLVLVGWLA